MPGKKKINCWEYKDCGYGPGTPDPCPAITDMTCHGFNSGIKAGRLCWTVNGAPCKHDGPALLDPIGNCRKCDFFLKVKEEEGENFHLLKLGQSVHDVRKLHYYISQIESLIAIRERLFANFDLKKNIEEIVAETEKRTGARYCGVWLIRGEPPKLFLETRLQKKKSKLDLPLDETTAVGFAATHNQIISLKEVSKDRNKNNSGVPFSMWLDQHSGVRTECFAAIPFTRNDGRVLGVLTAANCDKGFFSQDDLWFMNRYGFELSFALEKAKLLEESISAVRLASIGETVAGLAHCMKGIAHALKVSSYVVRKEIEKYSTEDLCTAWAILEKNIARLADLSVDVLSHKSGLAGTMTQSDLNLCARDAVRLLTPEAAARTIKFSASYGKDLSNCLINPSRIYRCLVNLIINAFDACTPQGGAVTVKTERVSPREVLISVIDTGRGMDERTKSIVFDLFKSTKKTKGQGLGLPTVNDIVKQHNGRIEIDSKKGEGTTIRIFLRTS